MNAASTVLAAATVWPSSSAKSLVQVTSYTRAAAPDPVYRPMNSRRPDPIRWRSVSGTGTRDMGQGTRQGTGDRRQVTGDRQGGRDRGMDRGQGVRVAVAACP